MKKLEILLRKIIVVMFCSTLSSEVWKNCKRDLVCLKCGKKYSDWRSLKKHMNFFCQVEPQYPCPFCKHRARINTLLKYHIMREHKDRVSTDSEPSDRQEPVASQYVGREEYFFE